jgi:UDP-N-acetylmuramoylalanine--D-glutamate ligase
MIPLRAHAGRRVSVLSLRGAGLTAARALAAGGAEVTVWDSDETRRSQADACGLSVEDLTTRDWSDLSALVVGDESLLKDDPAPRLIDMARALEAPILTAEALLAEGYVDSGARLAMGMGRQATAALDFAAHLLAHAGYAAIGPRPPERLRDPGSATVVLAPFDTPAKAAKSPAAACLLDGSGPAADLRALAESVRGPLVLSADDAAVRRLSVCGLRRASLVSGRSALSRGVFVAAGRLFDALDGRARPVGALSRAPGCAQGHPLALAAGYALARGLGASFEDARDGISAYAGCPGHGAPLGALGPIVLADWSSAVEPRAVVDALKRAQPAVWLAGPSVDPNLPALLEASGAAPCAAVLTGDRRRARRKLGRHCPVHVERDGTSAMALAVHAAMQAGPGASILFAPGGPCDAGQTDRFAAALTNLMTRARQGDAA